MWQESNLLSSACRAAGSPLALTCMVRPRGLEPLTSSFGSCCSGPTELRTRMVPPPCSASDSLDLSSAGVEPASPASCVWWDSNPHADQAEVFETSSSTVPSQTHWGDARVSIPNLQVHILVCRAATIAPPYCGLTTRDAYTNYSIVKKLRRKVWDSNPRPLSGLPLSKRAQ